MLSVAWTYDEELASWIHGHSLHGAGVYQSEDGKWYFSVSANRMIQKVMVGPHDSKEEAMEEALKCLRSFEI